MYQQRRDRVGQLRLLFFPAMQEQYADNFDLESKQKLAVIGAFSLYLNLINVFQLLLNLTGERDE